MWEYFFFRGYRELLPGTAPGMDTTTLRAVLCPEESTGLFTVRITMFASFYRLEFIFGVIGSCYSQLRTGSATSSQNKVLPLGVIFVLITPVVLIANFISSPGKIPLRGMRISRSKIDKLACQAQSVGIFAIGEYPGAPDFSLRLRSKPFVTELPGLTVHRTVIHYQNATPLRIYIRREVAKP